MLGDGGDFEDDKIYESREMATPPVYDELPSSHLAGKATNLGMHHAMTLPVAEP